MSLPLVLVLLSFGIALSQAASSARAVTLSWLRLGDLIALSLLGVAGAALVVDAPEVGAPALRLIALVLATGALIHLMLVQSGRRAAQRIAIGLTCLLIALALTLPHFADSLSGLRVLGSGPAGTGTAPSATGTDWPVWFIGPALVLAAWLTGGSLMTMLLGHAYLTSGAEMTQQPFIRLVRLLFAGLLLRLAIALLAGLWPWWAARGESPPDASSMVTVLMLCARFLMGIAVPLIMTWMALQCVRIRSNQSATGILYVSSTMILVGEFLGLTLATTHALPF